MAKRSRRMTSALVGGGSVLDIGGTGTYRALRRLHSTSGEGSDWTKVGRDLKRAMKKASKIPKTEK